jgi:hypothetical protein
MTADAPNDGQPPVSWQNVCNISHLLPPIDLLVRSHFDFGMALSGQRRPDSITPTQPPLNVRASRPLFTQRPQWCGATVGLPVCSASKQVARDKPNLTPRPALLPFP